MSEGSTNSRTGHASPFPDQSTQNLSVSSAFSSCVLCCLSDLGIPPAPRGVPQIEVSFDLDANGYAHRAHCSCGGRRLTGLTLRTHRHRSLVHSLVPSELCFQHSQRVGRKQGGAAHSVQGERSRSTGAVQLNDNRRLAFA